MVKYIFLSLLMICSISLQAQDTYIVASIKGTVKDAAGKKIVLGAKVKPSDKLMFSSKTSMLILAHPKFGRMVVSPGNSKLVTVKDNMLIAFLRDLLPSALRFVGMAATSAPPQNDSITMQKSNEATPVKPVQPPPKLPVNKGNILMPGQHLLIGEYMFSINRLYKLSFHENGNLIITKQDTQFVWGAGLMNKQTRELVLETEGNLCIYDNQLQVIWQTDTKGSAKKAGHKLVLEDNGELILYNANDKPVWNNYAGKL